MRIFDVDAVDGVLVSDKNTVSLEYSEEKYRVGKQGTYR